MYCMILCVGACRWSGGCWHHDGQAWHALSGHGQVHSSVRAEGIAITTHAARAAQGHLPIQWRIQPLWLLLCSNATGQLTWQTTRIQLGQGKGVWWNVCVCLPFVRLMETAPRPPSMKQTCWSQCQSRRAMSVKYGAGSCIQRELNVIKFCSRKVVSVTVIYFWHRTGMIAAAPTWLTSRHNTYTHQGWHRRPLNVLLRCGLARNALKCVPTCRRSNSCMHVF
jgi:hypothetical protein